MPITIHSPRSPMGSNMKRLIAMKMAKDAIPPGEGLSAAIKTLTSPEKVSSLYKGAILFSRQAVLAVRHAAEPNPFKGMSDEEIAGEIVRRAEKNVHS